MNTYEFTHTSQCPNGNLMDSYKITLKSAGTIQVELILETLKQAPEKIYQEDLATFLRSRLAGEITIVGWHHGIKITTKLA